ncbi:MAG: hypothetical protein M1822_007592 [Bathelium mastoideum]|nr:MAG: hypothetical protein M1822_007592 [Bathelium mastoideum]
MDIDATSFPGKLLDIFVAISESQFVSFDLELSGIPSKQHQLNDRRHTLQERYEDVKRAAERYQILQIGLTCVKLVNGPASSKKSHQAEVAYGVHPYNFNLSPIIPERTGVERIFSFQSGAIQFLIEHGFQIDLPFVNGVPYLSRDEAKQVKEKEYAKLEKAGFADIDLGKPGDAAALEFMDDVRRAIQEWQKTAKSDYLDIKPTVRKVPIEDQEAVLSKFEMRLIHQLVRSEFSDLRSIGRRGYVQIIPLDEQREEAHRNEKRKQIKERITIQTGFRLIIEWMAGGNVSKINPEMFARNPESGGASFADLDYLRSRWSRAKDKMKNRRTIIAGHNLFTDLIYLYRTFIGPLPKTVEEHARNIHELFPRVIDTKYMATHNVGRIKPDSSLDGLEWKLAEQEQPVICRSRLLNKSIFVNLATVLHPHHDKYSTNTAFHEAGYDSLVTARVFIRLSARLEALGCYNVATTKGDQETTASSNDLASDEVLDEDSDTGYVTAKEESSLADLLSGGLSKAGNAVSNVKTSLLGTSNAIVSPTGGPKKKKKKGKGRKKKSSAPAGSRFSQPTAYDQLQNMPEEDPEPEGEEAVAPDTSFEKDTQGPVPSDGNLGKTPLTEQAISEASQTAVREFTAEQLSFRELEPSRKIPDWDSDFWRIYENKLRVFGTEEEVCILGTG